jgi:hypothetical protein
MATFLDPEPTKEPRARRPVVGARWTPPDIGIARLRAAVFRPFVWKLTSEDE